MDEETTLNFEQYEKLKGTPVRYGQIIQLVHFNSNKYLYYDLTHVSDYESDNLKLKIKYFFYFYKLIQTILLIYLKLKYN